MPRILVYGYGNPGRQDDGLGVALAGLIEKERIAGVDTDCNYQLNIEDAHTIADYDAVVFVDASIDAREPFEFRRLEASLEINFTTHALSAQSLLALCEDLFEKKPRVFVLAIRGYQWDAVEGLTSEAKINLRKAFDFLSTVLEQSSTMALEEAASTGKALGA